MCIMYLVAYMILFRVGVIYSIIVVMLCYFGRVCCYTVLNVCKRLLLLPLFIGNDAFVTYYFEHFEQIFIQMCCVIENVYYLCSVFNQ